MKKTLTALSLISAALFSAQSVAGQQLTEYAYKNGDKISVAPVNPEIETSLTTGPDQKPILSINSPNRRGISHNIFTDYNVGKIGLTIDNEDNAKTIINEVIGGNKSRLRGNIFIKGGKASLLIVNPNGVVCLACSSTNTSLYSHRKTLPVVINTAQGNDVIFKARKPLTDSDRLTDIRQNISLITSR